MISQNRTPRETELWLYSLALKGGRKSRNLQNAGLPCSRTGLCSRTGGSVSVHPAPAGHSASPRGPRHAPRVLLRHIPQTVREAARTLVLGSSGWACKPLSHISGFPGTQAPPMCLWHLQRPGNTDGLTTDSKPASFREMRPGSWGDCTDGACAERRAAGSVAGSAPLAYGLSRVFSPDFFQI